MLFSGYACMARSRVKDQFIQLQAQAQPLLTLIHTLMAFVLSGPPDRWQPTAPLSPIRGPVSDSDAKLSRYSGAPGRPDRWHPNRTTQSDYGTHFGLRRDVVPLLWSYRKTSRPLAPNRTTQSDYGTHFGLRRDVVPLLWSYRKTSRPLAPNRTTQSDYGTHFGLRRDVVPLLWSYRKTSRPLAPNRTIQSD
ncbi:unnamed protein product [Gadus morhua 'NCC']